MALAKASEDQFVCTELERAYYTQILKERFLPFFQRGSNSILVLASQLVTAYFSSKSPIREFATAEPIELEISF